LFLFIFFELLVYSVFLNKDFLLRFDKDFVRCKFLFRFSAELVRFKYLPICDVLGLNGLNLRLDCYELDLAFSLICEREDFLEIDLVLLLVFFTFRKYLPIGLFLLSL